MAGFRNWLSWVFRYLPADHPNADVIPHNDGRRGISVVQGYTCPDYPLIQPSTDIRYLLADLALVYTDPALQMPVQPPVVPPLRIRWLYGFGTRPVTPPRGVYNRHDADICIEDSDGNTVFDSTAYSIRSYDVRDWGNRLRIHEWYGDYGICRVVEHTCWPASGLPEPVEYDAWITPESAVIDARCVRQMPRGIQQIYDPAYGHAGHIQLAGGYNTVLSVNGTASESRFPRVDNVPRLDDSLRPETQIEIAIIPGAGAGRYPAQDCPEPTPIRRINGIGPDQYGNVSLSGRDCYWVQPWSWNFDATSWTKKPANAAAAAKYGSVITAYRVWLAEQNLPMPEDAQPEIHLQIGNDCQPCCSCQDFVNAAEYIQKVIGEHRRLGLQVETLRDVYHYYRQQWLQAALCYQRRAIQVRLQPQDCPFLDVAAQYCNRENYPVSNLELVIVFDPAALDPKPKAIPGYAYVSQFVSEGGVARVRLVRAAVGGEWPVFRAAWDTVPPRQSVNVRFRLGFPECGEQEAEVPYRVTATVQATIDGEPLTAPGNDEEPQPVTATDSAVVDCPPGGWLKSDIARCLPSSCEQE